MLDKVHIIIIILLPAIVLAYDMICPDCSQRQFRSVGVCVGKNDTKSVYACLEDVYRHIGTFIELCSSEDIVRPGQRFVFKGAPTNDECSAQRYQPLLSYKSSGPMCLYLKSRCSEVGQVVANNGSGLADTTCICDYTEGYAYVTRPNDVCNCVASEEDCTCYKKPCPENHRLSAENECIRGDAIDMTECPFAAVRSNSTTTPAFTALPLSKIKEATNARFAAGAISIFILVGMIILLVIFYQYRIYSNLLEPKKDWREPMWINIKSIQGKFVRIQLMEASQFELISTADIKNLHTVDNSLALDNLLTKSIVNIKEEKDFDNFKKAIAEYSSSPVQWEEQVADKSDADEDQFMVSIERENEDEFFQRISELWKNRNFAVVLNFNQMMFKQFRKKLISKIKLLDPVHLSMSGHELESALEMVCKAGYYDMFCFLSKQKSDHSINDKLLQSACYGGNVDIVKDLINMGADVNTYSFTPLLEACTHGHLPIVTLLINKGVDVNQTKHKYSPLISACKGGHLPIVTLLIDKGANVNQTTHKYSPLISACEGGHLPIVTLLIDSGANVNKKTDNYTPLISACEGGHLPIVTLLIDRGANVNKETDNYTPLISACEGGHLPIVTLLIDKGADVNKNTENYTPLISACENGHLTIVTLLIEIGADVNKKTDNYSPLISACDGGHLQMVSLLMDKGADVNQTTHKYSPLISACEGGHLPIVTLLIDRGADVNQTTHEYSPLISACEGGNLPIVTLLIDTGADVNQTTHEYSPLISACEVGHLRIVTLLINSGADVNTKTDNYSPLISACGNGHLPIVTLLVDKGADVNQTTHKYSPLISACEGGHLPIVTFLIDRGANVNRKTDNYSPLISACESGHLPIVTLLIEKGATLNLKNSFGRTPLYYAKNSFGQNSSVVHLLVQKGAEI